MEGYHIEILVLPQEGEDTHISLRYAEEIELVEPDRIAAVCIPNVLMSDKPDYDHLDTATVLGSSYHRDQIRTVTFLDAPEDRAGAWDAAQEGSVTVSSMFSPGKRLSAAS